MSLQQRISLAGALNTAVSILTATKQNVTLDSAFKLAEEIVARLDKVAPVSEEKQSFKRQQLTSGKPTSSRPFFGPDKTAQFGKHKGKTFEDLVKNEPGFIEWLKKDEQRAAEIAKLEAAAGGADLPY